MKWESCEKSWEILGEIKEQVKKNTGGDSLEYHLKSSNDKWIGWLLKESNQLDLMKVWVKKQENDKQGQGQ